MIINKIVASSWYLSSFSCMMHGHTYIKVNQFLSAGERTLVGMHMHCVKILNFVVILTLVD